MPEPRRIDESRPYGEIFGLPGAAYEQDGLFFNSGKVCVSPENTRPILEGNSDEQRVNALKAAAAPVVSIPNVTTKPFGNLPAAQPSPLPPVPVAQATVREPTDAELLARGFINIDTVHWKVLRALVETQGGKWTNKADGYAFLKANVAA